MAKKVRDLRLRFEALASRHPGETDDAVTLFLESLADLDDMSIEEFFSRLFAKPKTREPSKKPPADPKALASRLRDAFPSDDLFHNEIEKLDRQKTVTKPILTKIYYDLFNRTRGVPSKATRVDLLRLIEDERNKIVRDGKMRDLLAGRIVPAE